MLVDALEELAAVHDDIGSPLRAAMRPGLSRAETERMLTAAGIPPHEALLDVYGWADGLDFDRWRALDPGGVPMVWFPDGFTSLQRTVEVADLFHTELGSIGAWQREWCPVFWHQTSGHLIDGRDGTVRYVTADDTVDDFIAADLETLVRQRIDDFRQGVYFHDPEHGIQSI